MYAIYSNKGGSDRDRRQVLVVESRSISRQRRGGPTTNNNNNNNNSTARKLLQKALQLYELSYQLIVSDRATGCYFSGSLRLTMIITNNLSEIHRIVGNTKKHTMCLQHLLCAIMYMVDSSVDNDDILNSNELDGFFCNVSPIMSGTNKDNACAQVA
jgi:hypothetical protein